jgi:tRNA (guanine37-N1)-methyltransferase
MKFYVLTIFPEMVETMLRTSILGRAEKNGILEFDVRNIRDYSLDKHKKTDDYPYGGGAGMVMTPQPVFDAHQAIVREEGHPVRTIYLTPAAKVFTQKDAKAFAKEEELILLCGHYEGVDQRVLDAIVTDYVSIGDYVVTGGEIAAGVVVDAISRMVPGVLTNESSAEEESFEGGLLEYPQYTRPEIWNDVKVPEILLSGDHAKVDAWRKEQSLLRTREIRPDLLKKEAPPSHGE